MKMFWLMHAVYCEPRNTWSPTVTSCWWQE